MPACSSRRNGRLNRRARAPVAGVRSTVLDLRRGPPDWGCEGPGDLEGAATASPAVAATAPEDHGALAPLVLGYRPLAIQVLGHNLAGVVRVLLVRGLERLLECPVQHREELVEIAAIGEDVERDARTEGELGCWDVDGVVDGV
jgi:hypothetical protein